MKNSTREDECKTVFADIREGAFYPIFQPIYRLQRENQIGAEVLTRWNKPRCNEKSFRCIEEEGYANFFTQRLFKKLSTSLGELPESIRFISVNIPPSYLSSLSFFLMRFRYLKHVSVLE
ncbi:EAL domain-containing protein [Vibrio campbellii]|uniref:EAL domain-containing protein n=1 Tax=Vibrio campbellii TaxID=680 RepID=UPI000AD133F4|nr:EAL domain-containing protein [Vibrio campbellii]